MLLGACSEIQFLAATTKRINRSDTPKATGETTGGGLYKVGKPYQIAGTWYYPAVDYGYVETGIASWYGPKFHGKPTANGEIFDQNDLTAAHRTLPMPSLVRVTNLDNGRSVVLRINDRGPFARSRIIDVSRRGAQLLGFENQGTARVRVEIMAEESRQIAARLQSGQPELAQAPIAMDANPRPMVAAESLQPPPGGATNPGSNWQNTYSRQGTEVASRTDVATPGVTSEPLLTNDPQPTGQVTQGAVAVTRMYVQAGAFSQFDSANRVKAMLSPIGNVEVSSVLVNGRDLYRVRVGPITSVNEADAALDKVIQAGYQDARVIVD